MSPRLILFLLMLCPFTASAQAPTTTNPDSSAAALEWNAPTRAVLLANRPAHLTEAQWLVMMRKPVNWSLYPLRITPGMRDTLDMAELDLRFHYLALPADP